MLIFISFSSCCAFSQILFSDNKCILFSANKRIFYLSAFSSFYSLAEGRKACENLEQFLSRWLSPSRDEKRKRTKESRGKRGKSRGEGCDFWVCGIASTGWCNDSPGAAFGRGSTRIENPLSLFFRRAWWIFTPALCASFSVWRKQARLSLPISRRCLRMQLQGLLLSSLIDYGKD